MDLNWPMALAKQKPIPSFHWFGVKGLGLGFPTSFSLLWLAGNEGMEKKTETVYSDIQGLL